MNKKDKEKSYQLMKTKEIRSNDIEISSDRRTIVGYPIVFNSKSEDIGFFEYIDPHAFDGVDLSKVQLVYNHQDGDILARVDSNSLKLEIDERGIKMEAQLPKTSLGNDVLENIKNGNVKGASFGFTVLEDKWERDNDVDIRTILKIKDFFEITLTPNPAYQDTTIALRSLNKIKRENNMSEEFQEKIKELLDSGLTEEEILEVLPADSSKYERDKKDDKDKDEEKESESKEKEAKSSKGEDDKEKSVEDDDENTDADKDKEKKEDEKRNRQGAIKMNIVKNSIKERTEEKRSAINAYIRSRGAEKRDGLTSIGAETLIPEEIIYNPNMEVHTIDNLSALVEKVPVKTASGKYPILQRPDSVMHTVEELEKNPELAKPEFLEVLWNINTLRGIVPISQEAIDDAQTDLTAIVSRHISDIKLNTVNAMISKKLESFTEFAKGVTKETILDKIKEIKNVILDIAYNKELVMNQSMYQVIDTLKDTDGRYLLQDPITPDSPKTLFGMNVYVISNDSFTKNTPFLFIGDLKRSVLFADRADVAVRWIDNDVYGQVLQSVIRLDVEKSDENAGFTLSMEETTPEAPSKSKSK